MAPIPEWRHAGGRERLRRALGRWVGLAAAALRWGAFWTGVVLGACLPAVLLLDLPLPRVGGLCLLAVAALVVGRSHRPR